MTNGNYYVYYIEQNKLQYEYWGISDSKKIKVIYRHIINIIYNNQVENEIHDCFVEKYKELCKKSKVLIDSNLINCQTNINKIDFDLSLLSEETNFPKRDLKLKFMSKILILELYLQIDNEIIYTKYFELKYNKPKLFL